jgi:hypothetical protein
VLGPVLTSPRASCRPRWSSGRLSRQSAICWSRRWFRAGDVVGSFEAVAIWLLAPSTVVDGGVAVGRGALVSDEGASWIAAAKYANKDEVRRRVVTQRSISACRHPPR